MKKLIILATIASLILCSIADAIVIQYTVIDPYVWPWPGAPILGTPGGAYDPNSPLVQLIFAGGNGVSDGTSVPWGGTLGDDVEVRFSSMGMNAGPNMCIDAYVDGSLVGGEAFFIRVFDAPAGLAAWYGDSNVFHVEQDSQTGAPLDTFPVIVDLPVGPIWPEPSILLSGMVLLLLRKMK